MFPYLGYVKENLRKNPLYVMLATPALSASLSHGRWHNSRGVCDLLCSVMKVRS